MNVVETSKAFEVSFDYDPKKVDAMRQIPGARWVKEKGHWHVPLYREKEITNLLVLYSPRFESILVPEQAGEVMPLPELNIDIPLVRPLFPFQSSGVAYALKHKRLIMGDAPGLGKSSQAIATVLGADAFPCLVVCPSTLKLNWQNEWKIVAGKRVMILNDTVKNSWEMYYKTGAIDVFIVNYESLKKFFVRAINNTDKDGNEVAIRLNHIVFRENIDIFKSVVFDEIHKLRSPATQVSKFCLGIARNKEVVLGLTGTPLVNKPKDISSQLAIIGRLADVVSHIPLPKDRNGKQSDFSGWKRFQERYCYDNSYLKELNYRLNLMCFYRRQKEEVLKDFPDKTRQVLICDITNRKEYDQAQNNFSKYLKEIKKCTDQEVRRKLRGEVMVKIGILKQLSARGKLESVREWVEEMVDAGEKVVIFCFLKEIIQEIMKMFPNTLAIYGDVSEADRDRNVRLFQTNPAYNVMVCNYKSAGVGLNLTASSNVGFIEFPWTAADCEQCEDRIYRIGTKKNVQAVYFLGDHTIDKWCYSVIQKKKEMGMTVTGSIDYTSEEVIDNLIGLFN